MFGEPRRDGSIPPLADVVDRVDWWAEIFQTPCVAYAARLADVAPLAAAGADFVAREAGADEDDKRRQTEAEIARLRQRAGERLAHDVDTVAAQARGWLDALVGSATAESNR